MPTWALALLLLAVAAGMWAVALLYTRHHPIEQENPWQPKLHSPNDQQEPPPSSPRRPTRTP